MPRKLKTYITTSGFYQLAVAAPSMKAATELWGSQSNVFQKGFASETDDAAIVKETLEHPGIILRRPVGTPGAFKEHADLPKLSALQSAIGRKAPPEPIAKKAAKSQSSKRTNSGDATARRRAGQLYDLAEKRRERDEQSAEAQNGKERERRERAIEKMETALKEARIFHEGRMAEIATQRDLLDRKERAEEARWNGEKGKLGGALRAARDGT